MRVAARPCVLELGHERVEGDVEGVHHLLGEMGIQSGGLRASMAQDLLDNPEVYPMFQKVGGVRVAKSMDGGVFSDAALVYD